MPRLALAIFALLLTAGYVAPALSADESPPPIDWSDFIDSITDQTGADQDSEVGEEMC